MEEPTKQAKAIWKSMMTNYIHRKNNSILPNKHRSHTLPNYILPLHQYQRQKHIFESLAAIVHPLKQRKNINNRQLKPIQYPKALHTNKSDGTLLSDLHTERTGHGRLFAVAFHSYVFFLVELFVSTTMVFAFRIVRRCTHVTSYGVTLKSNTRI